MKNMLTTKRTRIKQPSRLKRHLKLWKLYISIAIIAGVIGYIVLLGTMQFAKQIFRITAEAPSVDKAYALVAPTPIPFKEPVLADIPERERNIGLIKHIFGKDASVAIQVFKCESGLRTLAMNEHNNDGFPDVGIAQIHVTSGSLFTVEEMKNPVANLFRAKEMFDTRGWQPWASSNACHHMWK